MNCLPGGDRDVLRAAGFQVVQGDLDGEPLSDQDGVLSLDGHRHERIPLRYVCRRRQGQGLEEIAAVCHVATAERDLGDNSVANFFHQKLSHEFKM